MSSTRVTAKSGRGSTRYRWSRRSPKRRPVERNGIDRYQPASAKSTRIRRPERAARIPLASPIPTPGRPSGATISARTKSFGYRNTYARSNAAALGEPILQPSPRDGGGDGDAVGELVGYVPIEDGVRVDVAARSVDRSRESASYFELEDSWPTGVRREGYEALRGETVTKTGRTTAITSATVEATSASVRVSYGEDHGPVLLREQLIAGPMSDGGDSGSPVFLEDGTLVGLLFAGSAEQTVCNRIATVEDELGVEICTHEPDDGRVELDEEVPVYTTTMDHTVSVDLEAPAPSLESLEFADEPRPGETVDVIATVAAEPGEYWLAVGDERTTVSIAADHRATSTLSVPVPNDANGSFTVRIRGGPIGALE
ncbi:chymotrypsin family serine protease [Natronorubrum halophilum]|uniref:hypothetical protein n=1 Tax=Natronorubrum halophilum TaxID=1702106 RepID=UPI00308464CE